ncbi:hypothetical protein ANCCAN_08302 [Ancylostoma caninum]|uniref:Uncharacterized protein n=1 Tax=Ancylostoma caninum TaxID=29170 RepID=A0A368GRK4_ANCCA|nr:hypothetical protein ANCCAN_08302 [Ancylostoma caninum]
MRQVVAWLVDIIKTYEPQLRVEVRHHSLKDCYAIYLTADYRSLLKGAELCHIKKQVKSRFGGGLREFSFEEAQCFAGIEGRNTFLTDMERALIGEFPMLCIEFGVWCVERKDCLFLDDVVRGEETRLYGNVV